MEEKSAIAEAELFEVDDVEEEEEEDAEAELPSAVLAAAEVEDGISRTGSLMARRPTLKAKVGSVGRTARKRNLAKFCIGTDSG